LPITYRKPKYCASRPPMTGPMAMLKFRTSETCS